MLSEIKFLGMEISIELIRRLMNIRTSLDKITPLNLEESIKFEFIWGYIPLKQFGNHQKHSKNFILELAFEVVLSVLFVFKRRARFYKLVASVYGTFASRVSRCRGFDYKRGGGYTP